MQVSFAQHQKQLSIKTLKATWPLVEEYKGVPLCIAGSDPGCHLNTHLLPAMACHQLMLQTVRLIVFCESAEGVVLYLVCMYVSLCVRVCKIKAECR